MKKKLVTLSLLCCVSPFTFASSTNDANIQTGNESVRLGSSVVDVEAKINTNKNKIYQQESSIDLRKPNLDVDAYFKAQPKAEYSVFLPLGNGQTKKVQPVSGVFTGSYISMARDFTDFYKNISNQCAQGRELDTVTYNGFIDRMKEQSENFIKALTEVADGKYDYSVLLTLLETYKAETDAYRCVFTDYANKSNDFDYRQQVQQSIASFVQRDIVLENTFKLIKYVFIDRNVTYFIEHNAPDLSNK